MKSNFNAPKANENNDTLPDQAGVYVPPRPVAPLSEHRTMDIKAIRLAAELDPRQARTQLRMQAPPRRRTWSPFWIASICLGVLLGVGVYLTFLSETPLPLSSSEQRAPEPPSEAVVAAEPPIDRIAPPPPPLPDANPRAAATARTTSAERATGDETLRSEPAARASVPATTAEPLSAPRPAAPRKSKPRRDPWLE